MNMGVKKLDGQLDSADQKCKTKLNIFYADFNFLKFVRV